MSCGVGEVTERFWEWAELIVILTAELILQVFRHFTYVTAHSPTLPLLHLRHSSFSNPSFTSPTSQALHLCHLASRPCFSQLLLLTKRWIYIDTRPHRLLFLYSSMNIWRFASFIVDVVFAVPAVTAAVFRVARKRFWIFFRNVRSSWSHAVSRSWCTGTSRTLFSFMWIPNHGRNLVYCTFRKYTPFPRWRKGLAIWKIQHRIDRYSNPPPRITLPNFSENNSENWSIRCANSSRRKFS